MPIDKQARSDSAIHGGKFDQFVLDVAYGIFSEALGREVSNVLQHNFLTREPLLADPDVDRSQVLHRILVESFGDFHSVIMDIIVEQVCKMLGMQQTGPHFGEPLSVLADARKAYDSRQRRASGVA